MRFAFVSRHTPTDGQLQIAKEYGIELIHIGDRDAFSVGVNDIDEAGAFDGVVVVHPAAALRLAGTFLIGVFENANRAPEGAPPQFEAKSLHIFDMRD
ncbi:MAG: hypothetical protein WC340_18360 [Kiritimatiellia bacterium]